MKQSTSFASGMIQQFHVEMMMLRGFQPIPTLEESAHSLSIPVLDPIPLSPRRDFHSLCRQGPWSLSAGSRC